VTVYRAVTTTWYGPGFYGNRTACGQRLTTSTLGVAHRTLPCGTRVALRVNGRSLVVPVIDRGPYARDVTYDLTSATAEQLGVKYTARIGAAVLSR
jgi:rare lipoprotein A